MNIPHDGRTNHDLCSTLAQKQRVYSYTLSTTSIIRRFFFKFNPNTTCSVFRCTVEQMIGCNGLVAYVCSFYSVFRVNCKLNTFQLCKYYTSNEKVLSPLKRRKCLDYLSTPISFVWLSTYRNPSAEKFHVVVIWCKPGKNPPHGRSLGRIYHVPVWLAYRQQAS